MASSPMPFFSHHAAPTIERRSSRNVRPRQLALRERFISAEIRSTMHEFKLTSPEFRRSRVGLLLGPSHQSRNA